MVDLRPCPFCGNNVRLEDREFDDFAGNFFTNTMSVIECKKCGISMKRHPKRGYGITDEQKQDLINSWNRRTELALLKEQEAVEPHYNARTNWYECGACHYSMTSGMHCRGELIPAYKANYCAKCGRAVMWND